MVTQAKDKVEVDMAGEATETLAQFAASLRCEGLPERVKDHCKHLLLDALACALSGHQGEETHQVEALAAALAQSREASVIGGGRLSLAGATLLNGYLITATTMCDVHRATMTHVTPEVIPPALAIAERDGNSGRDLMAAIAAGCEVTTRIGIGLDYPVFRKRGWHGPGVLGPFGAAAAVGRLRGFDAETMGRAFGLAGSQAAGTFAAWGTPTVKFHQCRGALSGLMAALLAEQKFVATREFLTAKDGGLFNTYAEGGRVDLAVGDLGRRWELQQIALRLWPSASLMQGMNSALFELLARHAIKPDEVKAVRVILSPMAFEMHGQLPRYRGKFEALISAHYTASVILHDRALTLAEFEPARYDDPALRRFAERQVAVRADPALSILQTDVEIETADGAVHAVRSDHPKGSFENPLTQAEVEDKFRIYAKGRLPASVIEEVIAAVNALEALPSTSALVDMLSPAVRRDAA
jgi:2-methylcitrate dehydratase PrpD